jgi:hypothetical protein
VDIKFGLGNENMLYVKKAFFEIFSGFFNFCPFQFSKKFDCKQQTELSNHEKWLVPV